MSSTIFPAFFTDQLGNKINLPQLPRRIISLVPSQTELLFDLGLKDRIVGITKFCIHPKEQVKLKKKIGGTKNFNLEIIHSLQPDLIIGNKEENYPEGIRELQQHYPVWMSDIFTLSDALRMIDSIGQITNTARASKIIKDQIRIGFDILPYNVSVSAAYFIWRKPYMVAARETFIHEIMQKAGLLNIFAHLNRYPTIEPADLAEANPSIILLSSEPYPFQEKHIREMEKICPGAIIRVVDGELFSWYGSRLIFAPPYLQSLRENLATALLKD